jgi:hypothetical protein
MDSLANHARRHGNAGSEAPSARRRLVDSRGLGRVDMVVAISVVIAVDGVIGSTKGFCTALDAAVIAIALIFFIFSLALRLKGEKKKKINHWLSLVLYLFFPPPPFFFGILQGRYGEEELNKKKDFFTERWWRS